MIFLRRFSNSTIKQSFIKSGSRKSKIAFAISELSANQFIDAYSYANCLKTLTTLLKTPSNEPEKLDLLLQKQTTISLSQILEKYHQHHLISRIELLHLTHRLLADNIIIGGSVGFVDSVIRFIYSQNAESCELLNSEKFNVILLLVRLTRSWKSVSFDINIHHQLNQLIQSCLIENTDPCKIIQIIYAARILGCRIDSKSIDYISSHLSNIFPDNVLNDLITPLIDSKNIRNTDFESYLAHLQLNYSKTSNSEIIKFWHRNKNSSFFSSKAYNCVLAAAYAMNKPEIVEQLLLENEDLIIPLVSFEVNNDINGALRELDKRIKGTIYITEADLLSINRLIFKNNASESFAVIFEHILKHLPHIITLRYIHSSAYLFSSFGMEDRSCNLILSDLTSYNSKNNNSLSTHITDSDIYVKHLFDLAKQNSFDKANQLLTLMKHRGINPQSFPQAGPFICYLNHIGKKNESYHFWNATQGSLMSYHLKKRISLDDLDHNVDIHSETDFERSLYEEFPIEVTSRNSYFSFPTFNFKSDLKLHPRHVLFYIHGLISVSLVGKYEKTFSIYQDFRCLKEFEFKHFACAFLDCWMDMALLNNDVLTTISLFYLIRGHQKSRTGYEMYSPLIYSKVIDALTYTQNSSKVVNWIYKYLQDTQRNSLEPKMWWALNNFDALNDVSLDNAMDLLYIALKFYPPSVRNEVSGYSGKRFTPDEYQSVFESSDRIFMLSGHTKDTLAKIGQSEKLDEYYIPYNRVIPTPGIKLCNTVIWALAREGKVEEIESFIDQMKNEYDRKPNLTSYAGLIMALNSKGQYLKSCNLLLEILERENSDVLNQPSFNALLNTCVEGAKATTDSIFLSAATKVMNRAKEFSINTFEWESESKLSTDDLDQSEISLWGYNLLNENLRVKYKSYVQDIPAKINFENIKSYYQIVALISKNKENRKIAQTVPSRYDLFKDETQNDLINECTNLMNNELQNY